MSRESRIWTSAWDLAHTAVLPSVGGALGALLAHYVHGSAAQATREAEE
jgi:hypothetical protein